MNDRPRGLGRGLSALLGEPIATALGNAPARPTQIAAPPAASAFAPVNVGAGGVMQSFPAVPPPFVANPFPEPEAVAAADVSSDPPPSRALPIAQVQANPNQPRRMFGEAELAELADSIRAHGVLQPILVRPAPGQPGRYEIVAGERRWRASQLAQREDIPAIVLELDEGQVLEIAIIENVQRENLNPLEEAHGYQQLIDRFGRTQQEIAEIVGKSRPHIANMLRLLGLPSEIQNMVRDGLLTAGHARAVLAAPNPVELARQAIEQALNVREVERLAARAKEEREGPRVRASAPHVEKDGDVRALEQQLSSTLGIPVSIQLRNEGGGEVKITYRSLEQLDDLCRRLSAG